jgi:hypothetical protein
MLSSLAAAGVVDAYSDITGEKWKPYAPPVAGPATVSQQRRRPKSPPSGEAVRAGPQDPALPPHRCARRWPGMRPHATDRQDSGTVLIKELGAGH